MPLIDKLLAVSVTDGQLKIKIVKLVARLNSCDKLFLAFSGGVDSALLAALAHNILGDKLQTVYFATPLAPAEEKAEAEALAAQIGCKLKVIALNPLELHEVRNNLMARCYFCKKLMFTALKEIAGDALCCDGSNADDAKGYRPGAKAMIELGIKSPLAEVGLNKKEIRLLAQACGLSVWDKPSSPCLATRFPYDCLLTEDNLEQVRQGELILRRAGFSPCRLRAHHNLARVQLDKNRQAEFLSVEWSNLYKLGFDFVTLDLAELQSGDFDKKGEEQ